MAHIISTSMRDHDDIEVSNFSSSRRQDKIEPIQVPESSARLVVNDGPGKLGWLGISIVRLGVFSEDIKNLKKIFDPEGPFIRKWNRIFLVACILSLFIDPLFFFLLVIREEMCIELEKHLKVILMIFRSLTDIFYVVQIILRFRTAYLAPSSRVFGRGQLVVDPVKIALRYLSNGFLLDFIAALPVPQVLIWTTVFNASISRMTNTRIVFACSIILQYVPRLFIMFPLSSEINKASTVVTKTAWVGAAYNMMLYILASNAAGACWYLLSVERQEFCWSNVCNLDGASCLDSFFDCRNMEHPDRVAWFRSSNITELCNLSNDFINYGIYEYLLSIDITSLSFFRKFFFCLWWGFQTLSSIGQNLETSTYTGENCFVLMVATTGLVLLSLLIGNMQTYLQSRTLRLEEWRIKRTDTEQWMQHRQLPLELRRRIQRYYQFKWTATRGVNEKGILKDLPKGLRRDIKRHLCLDLVRQVPLFDQMDVRILDAVCERLNPKLCTRDTKVVREGDPVNEMLFIITGHLNSYTTNGGRADFFNSCRIGPGDFCGEELLTWALEPHSSDTLPLSTRTVKSVSEVEAFALIAEDLKFVVLQFRRLHSKELVHKLRFYSPQWRTWAACFIQAAWRGFKRRKLIAELKAHESQTRTEGTLNPKTALAVHATRSIPKFRSVSRRVNFAMGSSEQKPSEPNYE